MKKIALIVFMASLISFSGSSLFAATADLSVTKTVDDNDGLTPGQQVTLTITVINNGPDTSSAVSLVETASDIVFVSYVNALGTCTASSTVSCTITPLASGATATVTLTYTYPNIDFSLTSTTVSSADTDPVSANNTETLTLVRSVAGCSLIR